MTKIVADLHCHSNASDGTDVPTRVVERAREVGLEVIALTDHDTIDGVAEAIAAGEKLGVRVVAGAELTCYVDGREVHVLGYGLRIDDPALGEHCRKFQEARIDRAHKIGERLATAGVPIDIEKVMAAADGGVVGRPHLAQALIDAGHVGNWDDAFDKYLGNGKPGDVPKLVITADEVVDVIRKAGGFAVMAHPGLGDQFDLVPVLRKAGAVGVEVWHSAHDFATTNRLDLLAMEQGLLKSGGSDCHGSLHGGRPVLGKWGLDRPRWEKFEKVLAKHA